MTESRVGMMIIVALVGVAMMYMGHAVKSGATSRLEIGRLRTENMPEVYVRKYSGY